MSNFPEWMKTEKKEMTPADLMKYDGPDRIVHFMEYLNIKELEKNNSLKLQSNFSQFDDKLQGLCTGELTVISGKTGEGKTLFSESYMKGLLDKSTDLKSCLFSFEVPPKTILEKYVNSPQMKIYLPVELKTSDFEWLYERVWEAAVKENCRLFVFDHLHFLIDMAEKQNMSLNIGRFMREIKTKIALELNVAVVLIAHQKGSPKGEEPGLEDIRDSSFIAQESDNVVICWRKKNFTEDELTKIGRDNPVALQNIKKRIKPSSHDEYSDGFAVVQIAKARRSGTFRWIKLFQKVGSWLEEV